MENLKKRALLNSLGTLIYIILVTLLLSSLRNFPNIENKMFIPIAMLLLLVCSAAITGLLVFGKPAMLYIDGKKKEAITLLAHTLGILVLITLVAFILLILFLR